MTNNENKFAKEIELWEKEEREKEMQEEKKYRSRLENIRKILIEKFGVGEFDAYEMTNFGNFSLADEHILEIHPNDFEYAKVLLEDYPYIQALGLSNI